MSPLPRQQLHHVDRLPAPPAGAPANTSDPEINGHIQRETVALYDKYIEANALAWTQRRGLLALDLGAAHRKPPGYVGVDQRPEEGIDIVATLPEKLDLPDGSVGLMRAVEFEQVHGRCVDRRCRLLAPGGMLLVMSPSPTAAGPAKPGARRPLQRELVLVLHGRPVPYLRARDRGPVPVVAAGRLLADQWHSRRTSRTWSPEPHRDEDLRCGGPLLV